MTLLAAAAAQQASTTTTTTTAATTTTTTTFTAPDLPATGLIHTTVDRDIEWTGAQTLAVVAGAPPATQLREQDDIIYDPGDESAPWKFYFTGSTANNNGVIWVTTSVDRATWGAPVQCTVGGSAMNGQDPSIVQALATVPHAVRFGGSLVMYFENNSTNDIDVASSADGIAWTIEQASVISTGTGWESELVGSPVARYDGSRFIVGYEGIASTDDEQFGLAYGTSMTSLAKHASNPVFGASDLGLPGISAFGDSMWLTPDGARIIITGHAGSSQGTTMFRAYTTNTDPTTWQTSDFVGLGNVTSTVRNDLTCDWWGDRLVTAPNDDQTMVAVTLVP